MSPDRIGRIAIAAMALAAAAATRSHAQQAGVIAGHVRADEGRAIAGAVVRAERSGMAGAPARTEADSAGAFRLSLGAGTWRITASSVGYAEAATTVDLAAGDTVRVELLLDPRAVELPGVRAAAERARAAFESQTGATRHGLLQRELKRLPGVAEADVLRAVEVLPGVVSTSDFSAAYNVRGGGADQNLILLDGLPIYNPFHLGGVFSVFNADMVARAELLSGGFPAEYGGRVSSVLEVESDAAGVGTDVAAGVSVLAARAAVGMDVPDALTRPLGLRTGRVRVSLRRSYFDQLLAPFVEFPYHLLDLQAYAEGWSASGGRATLTGYYGRDVLDLAGTESFPLQVNWGWGNALFGGRWTGPVRAGLLDVRAGWSRFDTAIRFPDFGDVDFRSRIEQALVRADLAWAAGPVAMRTGAQADRLSYDNLARTGGTEFGGGRDEAWQTGAWARADWRPGAWLIEAGARVDAWFPGAGDAVVEVAPRVAVKRFLHGGDLAVKLAAGRYTQFVHSLRNEELPIGLDVWVLAGERASHVVSDQVQAGLEAYVSPEWFVAVEAYHREFDGVVTTNFADDPNDPLDDLVSGDGTSWGADLLVRRSGGRVRPTMAVSWLRAKRRFPDARAGADPQPIVEYAPIFDRRLDVELVVEADVLGLEAGLRWNLGTGLPYTKPLGGYRVHDYRLSDGARNAGDEDDPIGVLLGPRNAERYPAYHRLDLGLRRTYVKSWGRLTPYLEVLNVYGRRNVLFYFYEFDRDPPRRSGLSMFPLLPTIGAELAF